jgi:hypothetical protein
MARIPIAELKDSPEWLSLNPKQQQFVELYITNGYNAKAAYFAAYDCKDEHTARCASYARLQSPKIAMFLHLHFNGTPEQAFIRVIWNMILKNKLTKQQVEIMKLKRNPRRSPSRNPSLLPPFV